MGRYFQENIRDETIAECRISGHSRIVCFGNGIGLLPSNDWPYVYIGVRRFHCAHIWLGGWKPGAIKQSTVAMIALLNQFYCVANLREQSAKAGKYCPTGSSRRMVAGRWREPFNSATIQFPDDIQLSGRGKSPLKRTPHRNHLPKPQARSKRPKVQISNQPCRVSAEQ